MLKHPALTAPLEPNQALQRDQYIFIILFKYRLDILSNKLETGSIDLDSNRMCGRCFRHAMYSVAENSCSECSHF